MSTARKSIGLPRTARGKRCEVTRRKDPASMVKTKDKVYDAAENVKPYVERAMNDEKLRDDVMSAFATARGPLHRADRPTWRGHARHPSRHRRGDPREAQGHGRRSEKRGRPAPGQAVAQRPQHDAAHRGHRSRHPLQPGHRARDTQVGQGHARGRRGRVRRRLSVCERRRRHGLGTVFRLPATEIGGRRGDGRNERLHQR